MDFIDVEIVEKPKTLLGQKICQWLDFKLVRVGETGRRIAKGFYLLPKTNEEMFMMYKTWRYGHPVDYIVYNPLNLFKGQFMGSCEEELFYDVFLHARMLCISKEGLCAEKCYFTNPLLGKSVEEAMIWIDLYGAKA